MDFDMVWQYRGKKSWHDFDVDVNDIVDDAYQSGDSLVQFDIGGENYTIDFSTMKQRCDSDPRRARDVRPPGQCTNRSGGAIWQHRGQNRWQDFPPVVHAQVESAYHAGESFAEFVVKGEVYEINFGSMKQRCVHDSSRVREVRRLNSSTPATFSKVVPTPRASSDNRPKYWDLSTGGAGCARVPCGPELVKQFQALFDYTQNNVWTRDRRLRAGRARGVPAGYAVSAVWRLQDRARWNAFSERRTFISMACRSRPDELAECCSWRVRTAGVPLEERGLNEQCNEQYLFHGAPEAAVMAIVDTGIDLKKSRSDGLLGGNKIYLAENSTKADEYVGIDSARHMLLVCRAVLGIYKYTEESSPNLVAIDADLKSKYHSIWAHRRQTTRLNEIALANAAQVYPEYLVQYTRK